MASVTSNMDTEDLKHKMKAIKKSIVDIDKQLSSLNAQREALQNEYNQIKSQLQMICVQQSTTTTSNSSNYDKTEGFPWSVQIHQLLHEIFHLQTFRPMQIRAINATLDKQDVILVMPTGAGKSLVYQLPAFVNPTSSTFGQLTLIISPLVSLMTDQVFNLKRLGISDNKVALLDANVPVADQRLILSKVSGKTAKNQTPDFSLRLLYVTPEKLAKSKMLLHHLEIAYATGRLARIAIDEVHCASQWGHDFRPDYQFLHVLRRQFPQTSIIGLTATASAKVISDIQTILGLQPEKCLVLRTSYNRPNLFYEVEFASGSSKTCVDSLHRLIKRRFPDQCGIVYCFSQKDTEDVAESLCKNGLKAAPYHAYLDTNYRSKVHSQWANGHLQIIVATVAFGMGIDKPDVRFVLHYSSSKSLENYYQESGRAGRDGKPAQCVLIWRFADLFRLASMVSSERTGMTNLVQMVSYCIEPVECRRALIAQGLGDLDWSDNDCQNSCDQCKRRSSENPNDKLLQLDITELLNCTNSILDTVSSSKQERVTGPKLVELMDSNKSVQKVVSQLLNLSTKPDRSFYEYFVTWCLVRGFLKLDFHFTPYTTLCYIARGPNQSMRPMTYLSQLKSSTKRPLSSDLYADGDHPDWKNSRQSNGTLEIDLTDV